MSQITSARSEPRRTSLVWYSICSRVADKVVSAAAST